MLDIIAIAESTPGPIAINCATYIGYKRCGFLGSVFATLGVVLPSFLIIFTISFFIEDFLKIDLINKAFKGIQACVAILIIRAGIKMLKNIKKDVVSFVVLAIALIITITLNFVPFNLSSIYLIIAGGITGYIYYGLIKKEGAQAASANADNAQASLPETDDKEQISSKEEEDDK